jgi:hypothetical protein
VSCEGGEGTSVVIIGKYPIIDEYPPEDVVNGNEKQWVVKDKTVQRCTDMHEVQRLGSMTNPKKKPPRRPKGANRKEE